MSELTRIADRAIGGKPRAKEGSTQDVDVEKALYEALELIHSLFEQVLEALEKIDTQEHYEFSEERDNIASMLAELSKMY